MVSGVETVSASRRSGRAGGAGAEVEQEGEQADAGGVDERAGIASAGMGPCWLRGRY